MSNVSEVSSDEIANYHVEVTTQTSSTASNDVISRNDDVPAVVVDGDFLENFTTQLVVTDVTVTSESEEADFIEMGPEEVSKFIDR